MSKTRWKCDIHDTEYCAETYIECPMCQMKIPMDMKKVREIVERWRKPVDHGDPPLHRAELVNIALDVAVKKFDESQVAFFALAEKYRHLKEILEG